VSATEILSELPKLTHAERRAISNRLLELETERDTLQFAVDAAESAFLELDKLEGDASAQSR
jgi:hypothetical protein